MTKEEKLQFKFKYDKMLDDVFFTKEFKQYMIENCKFCPSGLTIDTNIAFQLKTAVDGITAIAAIHLIAIFEIKEDIGTLIGVDVDFIYAQNSPFAIELLVGGSDSHFFGTFLACHLVSHWNRHSLLFIHGFCLVGISLCVGVERNEHKANRQSRNYIFFHIIK